MSIHSARPYPQEQRPVTAPPDTVIDVAKELAKPSPPLARDLQLRLVRPDAPTFGAETARVTLVEFNDFQCPPCAIAIQVMNRIRAKYGNRVRIIFRQYPLFRHSFAPMAAQAALAAHAQGRFLEYQDKLIQNPKSLERSMLEQYARELGLDMQPFTQALEQQTYKSAVESDRKLGDAIGLFGTPHLFINGQRLFDATKFEDVVARIDAVL